MSGPGSTTSGKTWDEASSPEAIRAARRYEESWRRSGRDRPDLAEHLAGLNGSGVGLALFRTDMSLRWEAGEKVGAQWYRDRFPDLTEETLVALVYEEFCLREEVGEHPDPLEFQARFATIAPALERVFEIHGLVGSGEVSVSPYSTGGKCSAAEPPFPVVGQTIAGFHLVEELGSGSFARVFLAHERQLADRPVALKVTRRGSREPQTLARLQHTHIVPVYSHRVDPATGLNLLCMPYFGRITLSRILSESKAAPPQHGADLVETLDRLAPTETPGLHRSEGRIALSTRIYTRSIAWWGARLAEALQHAHERGVLHRDVKPSNVLVTADGMPMLLDFNLAREPLAEGRAEEAAGNLGGTIDYMAPEHLEGLADGLPHQVDGRSDLFSLGVVLYEAVIGDRPFPRIRKRSTASETLLSAADERRAGPPRLRATRPGVPPALETVIRRCLEPTPEDRYQSGGELAADLQAVADDRPLVVAREPMLNRIASWTKHRRRRLATAASIALAMAFALAAFTAVRLERWFDVEDQFRDAEALFADANDAYKKGEFDKAASLFSAADRHSKSPDWRETINSAQWRTPGGLQTVLARILYGSDRKSKLEYLQLQAHSMSTLAWARDQRCDQADAVHRAADGLRFRLIRLRHERASASRDLQEALQPFRVLAPAPIEDWTQRPDVEKWLDSERLTRLRHEVNELMFLWVCAIDETLAESTGSNAEKVAAALDYCDRALAFAQPKGPWRALRSRLGRPRESSIARDGLLIAPAGERAFANLAGLESLMVRDARLESSALAAFQWGLLWMRDRNLETALPWFERAVELEAKNHWYQYYLAFVYDVMGGRPRDALVHYDLAVDLGPDSPWIRFDRARLHHRAFGNWRQAVDDLELAYRELKDQPEARHILSELGIVHQSLGNDRKAQTYFETVIRADPADSLGRAARLNLANGRAESGRIPAALAEYGRLLDLDPLDQPARRSRALLLLKSGGTAAASSAEADLTFLVELGDRCRNRDEVYAARALARLIQGGSKADGAIEDATRARNIVANWGYARLRQRAILAAGRVDEIVLDRPDDVARLPLGGGRLKADLHAAVESLNRLKRQGSVHVYPASLAQAVMLSALHDPSGAEEKANRALQASPDSPRAYLIRARIRLFRNDLEGAMADAGRGLEMSPNDPALQEVKAAVLTRRGRPAQALKVLKEISAEGVQQPSIDVERARANAALGRATEATASWSLAIRKDPQFAEAYLGRARVRLSQGRWPEAVVDLSQAAAWANGDVSLEVRVFWNFTRCLAHDPNLAGRWLAMGKRLLNRGWAEWDDLRVQAAALPG